MTQKIVNSGLPDWTFVAIFCVFRAVSVKNYEETHRMSGNSFHSRQLEFYCLKKNWAWLLPKNDFSMIFFTQMKERPSSILFFRLMINKWKFIFENSIFPSKVDDNWLLQNDLKRLLFSPCWGRLNSSSTLLSNSLGLKRHLKYKHYLLF